MCGIFGAFGTEDGEARVEECLDRLSHRGPDGRGVASAAGAVHGHVRLAMLDLSAGSAQPYRVESTALSFVGEVWNHAELRVELKKSGRTLKTSGDVEPLAHALDLWGPRWALAKLDGMFAFAWTGRDGATWLARDRFGKVPLYVRRVGGAWEWSSERKAWGRAGGGAAPLPPGGLLRLNDGELIRWTAPRAGRTVDAAEVLAALRGGVRKRLAADVPVCVLLSGGLDSSLVALLAAEAGAAEKAFVAIMDEGSDDVKSARRLAAWLGMSLEEARVPRPTAESLSAAAACVELESKAQVEIAAACVPLARAVRAAGFKACLSGEAADELFGGYGNSAKAAAGMDDFGWRRHRLGLLERMSRGNFVRTNKAFMAAGVECRLPFMERALVEGALGCSKRECPPGKGLLKEAARLAGLPAWIVDRPKETFQGGAGLDAAAAKAIRDPARFYRNEIVRTYGRRTEG